MARQPEQIADLLVGATRCDMPAPVRVPKEAGTHVGRRYLDLS